MLISNQLLVTYGMTHEVDDAVKANRPGIVVLDEKECKALIIDVTLLMDINMIKAAASKYKKYRDLEIATKEQYRTLLVGVKCSLAPSTPNTTRKYASTYIGVSFRTTTLL